MSRASVRQALALLQAEGLIDRRQGIGTLDVHHKVVQHLREIHGVHHPEPGSLWSGMMRIQVLDWSEVALPSMAAEQIDAEAGEPSLRVDYVAHLDNQPLAVATNYVRRPEADRLNRLSFRTDWYDLLKQAGLVIAESTWLLEASLADEHDAELLLVPVGSPLMIAEQVIYDGDGVAFNCAVARTRGDRLAFLSRARRNAGVVA